MQKTMNSLLNLYSLDSQTPIGESQIRLLLEDHGVPSVLQDWIFNTLDAAEQKGFDAGYTAGRKAGYEDGDNEGYDEGYLAGKAARLE